MGILENYGGRVGFDVRKAYYNKSKKDGRITSIRFVCNKEGCRREDKRDHLTKCPRAEMRTNCPVRMGLVFNQEIGRYKVHDLIVEHNHMLHLAETLHMMTSQRKISNIQATEIDLADDSRIRLKASFEFMSRQGGGKESVGYTLRDQKNYLRTKRQRDLKYGEAESISRYFQQQTLSNLSFYHAEQLDDDEQITNIFWPDARMIMDYACFGDVITFDMTYNTNKDFRPLGVFLGFNHHRASTNKKCGKRPKSWVEKQPKIIRKKKKTILESQSLEIVEASNAMTFMSSSQVEGVPNTHTALLMAMSSTGPINRENPFNFGSSSQASSYNNGINGEPTHFINND